MITCLTHASIEIRHRWKRRMATDDHNAQGWMTMHEDDAWRRCMRTHKDDDDAWGGWRTLTMHNDDAQRVRQRCTTTTFNDNAQWRWHQWRRGTSTMMMITATWWTLYINVIVILHIVIKHHVFLVKYSKISSWGCWQKYKYTMLLNIVNMFIKSLTLFQEFTKVSRRIWITRHKNREIRTHRFVNPQKMFNFTARCPLPTKGICVVLEVHITVNMCPEIWQWQIIKTNPAACNLLI